MTLTGLAHPTRTPPRLVVSSFADRDATVIALQGDADVTALPYLVDAIAGIVGDGGGPIAVDLTDAEFIDTACLRVMALVARSLANDNRRMTFRSPSRLAVMLLATFGLAHLVETRRETEQ
jgi:anti-anti-sigma factor